MATRYITKRGEHLATRYYAGAEHGMRLQLEVTPTEYEAKKHEDVEAEDRPGHFEALHRVVDRHKHMFDTAGRRREAAQDLEQHRWADSMPQIRQVADQLRASAKRAAQDAIRARMGK